jgi:PAS domain S-box-containing protein
MSHDKRTEAEQVEALIRTNQQLQQEIETRQKIVTSLQESERGYRSLLDTVPVGLYRSTPDGRLLEANQSLVQILGYPDLQTLLTDQAVDRYLHREDRERWRSLIEQDGLVRNWEGQLRRYDGTIIWVRNSATAVRNAAGQVRYYQGVIEDITDRKRAEEERERFTNQLNTAAEVSTELAAILDIEQLLYNVVTLLQRRFDFYHVHVYLLNEAGDDLRMQVGSGEIGRLLRQRRHHIPLDHPKSLVARAARARQIIAVDDVRLASIFLPNPLLPETHSEVAIPLIVADKVLGVLDVQDNVPGRFSQSDLDVFSTLAGQIAIAVHNAYLFDEQNRAEKILQRYAARLETLRSIDRDILAARLPETIAQVALDHIRRMIPCIRATVVEFNYDTHRAEILAIYVEGETKVETELALPAQAFNLHVLEQGCTHVVEDLDALPQLSLLEQTIRNEGVRAYMNVPLIVQDELIGSLNVGADRPNIFTADHTDIAEEVTISLALAIQYARLFEQARRDAETKARLLHEVNHRVKNNLAAIVGLLYVEQHHFQAQLAGQTLLTDLINRVEGLATVHRLLSDSHWSPILLNELTSQILESVLQMLPSDRQVVTSISPAESVYVVPKQVNNLAMVINELATNTVKYAVPVQPTVVVEVRIVAEDGQIVLEYRDDGPGFPLEVLQGKRGNVGLYLINNIVRSDLHGEVSLRNDGGAVVTLCFADMNSGD